MSHVHCETLITIYLPCGGIVVTELELCRVFVVMSSDTVLESSMFLCPVLPLTEVGLVTTFWAGHFTMPGAAAVFVLSIVKNRTVASDLSFSGIEFVVQI
jgi:hypothetical protein